jgi:hypothetical protein
MPPSSKFPLMANTAVAGRSGVSAISIIDEIDVIYSAVAFDKPSSINDLSGFNSTFKPEVFIKLADVVRVTVQSLVFPVIGNSRSNPPIERLPEE